MFIRKCLLVFAVFISICWNAQGMSNIEIDPIRNSKKIFVGAENLTSEITVTLLSQQEAKAIESFSGNGVKFEKVFDLSNLAIGKYEFVIKTNVKEVIQPISIDDFGIYVHKDELETYFMPAIQFIENSLSISLMNGTQEKIKVRIEDSRQEVIFKEVFKNTVKLERRYDLKDLPADNYVVFVRIGRKSYFRKMTIK